MAIDTPHPILVVDDDPKIVRLVRAYLERAGHTVVEAGDGGSALEAIARLDPALVVLDLMLPGVDGLAILEAVRQRGATPVIIVSARGTTSDRIEGLGLGADDYLPKPFSPAELLARVERVLARSGASSPSTEAPLLEHAGLTVDRSRHHVVVDGRSIDLSVTELRLLVALLQAGGRVLTRDRLLDAVYGADADAVLDRTIDVLVGRVRSRLGDTAATPRFIETVRGAGYRATAVRPAAGSGDRAPDRIGDR